MKTSHRMMVVVVALLVHVAGCGITNTTNDSPLQFNLSMLGTLANTVIGLEKNVPEVDLVAIASMSEFLEIVSKVSSLVLGDDSGRDMWGFDYEYLAYATSDGTTVFFFSNAVFMAKDGYRQSPFVRIRFREGADPEVRYFDAEIPGE